MSELNTNLNISPYFDDFDEEKNYHQILFKPATAVQARELTQLQTILQNQVSRFGNNILQEGTIVKGGNFVEERRLPYVKVRDAGWDADDNIITVAVTEYVGMKAIGLTTGIEGIVVAAISGLESQSPNLATIYVRYTNNVQDGSDNNISSFSATEEIQIQRYNEDTAQYEDYHRLTAAGSIEGNSTGVGYGVRCGDGIMYQKGYFIRFEDAVTVVGRYTNAPDGIVVGFETQEKIIDSNADQSLLDNANGFNNENAPGADRLQLIPVLTAKTLAEAKADDTFFAVQEYQNGKVVRRRLTTQFDSINDVLRRRTVEESGNYALNDYKIRLSQSDSNTSNLTVSVGAGVSYVEGRRVELVSDYDIDIPEASEYLDSPQQDVIANYGSYITVQNMSGDFNPETYPSVNLVNAGATTIGTARLRTITRESTGIFRMYLTAVSMGSGYTFGDVRTVESGTATADVILQGGVAKFTDASFRSLIFPIGQSFVRSVNDSLSDAVYRDVSSATSDANGDFSVSLSGTDVFPYTPDSSLNSDQRDEIIVVAKESVGGYTTGEIIPVNSASVDSTGSILNISITAPTATMNVEVIHDLKKSPLNVNTKTLQTVYVKLDLSTHANGTSGRYSLGVPDGYELVSVFRDTVYTEDNAKDVTKHFTLDNGQTSSIYGLSKLRAKNTITLGSSDKLTVILKAFKKDSGPNALFTVDSYPVDDVTATLPSNKIRTESIPKFRFANGTEYYLRDVIDARPYADATATYAANLGTATVNPSGALSFTDVQMLSPNKSIEIEYSYYIGRRDILYIDQFGNFEVIQGVAAPEPVWPAEPSKGMVLATLEIPPFPSLPVKLANRAGKPDYGVTIARRENRRYTMRDIGAIEKRIGRLEYYTALTALENNAKDMIIPDENGLDRFKNGIFVDNFDTLSIADVNDVEFGAGIDPSESIIHPKFRTYPVNLKVKSSNNTTTFGDTITLEKSDAVAIEQPYATKTRSCTTNFYKYNGIMKIWPEYDVSPDYTRAPDVNIDINLQQPFVEFAEALNEFVPLQTESRGRRQSVWSTDTRNQTRTLTTSRTTTTTGLDIRGRTFNQEVGDFVTDINFSPYMRQRFLRISVSGLRPSTRFYFFFDGKTVDDNIANATVLSGGTIARTSPFGGQVVKSDANGVLRAIFRIPRETFFVGDRFLEISDLADYNDIANATSYAKARYSAFNFSVEKTGVNTSTRVPDISVGTSTEVTSDIRVFNIRNEPGEGSGPDPISQTFMIDRSQSSDTSVMLTKLDLFFAKKGSKGVTVEIREVVNGYPSPVVLPFSSVRLEASEVIASENTASTPTTVIFDAPVAIKKGVEYCFVVKPEGNDPDYRLWVSKVGGTDIDTEIGITQDTNAGTLFTSTNDKAWTAYQDENIKFTAYIAKFDTASGTVVFESNGVEFLEISEITQDFEEGEIAYVQKSSYAGGTVSVSAGSTLIAGSNTSFTVDYNEGDYIVMLADNGENEVLKIGSIANNTSMTSDDVAKRTVTAETQHYATTAGVVTYFTDVEPAVMILEESSARAGLVIANGDTILGENSEASALIDSVGNLPISWFQANIFRTNFGKTRTDITASKLWTSGTSYYTKNIGFGKNNKLSSAETYIRSKSNDANNSSFELTVDLLNVDGTGNETSPFVDGELSSITAYHYLVNNVDTNEAVRGIGECTSKYISRKVELADGMEAEDIKVFTTAYRPRNTDVDVYISFQSATDERDEKDVEWTKLVPKAETYSYSNPNKTDDYIEIEYGLDSASKTAGNGAWRDTSGNFQYIDDAGAVYTNYKFFTIKVCMKSTGFNRVPNLRDLRAIALT